METSGLFLLQAAVQDFLLNSQHFLFKLWWTQNQFKQRAKRSSMCVRLAVVVDNSLFVFVMQSTSTVTKSSCTD